MFEFFKMLTTPVPAYLSGCQLWKRRDPAHEVIENVSKVLRSGSAGRAIRNSRYSINRDEVASEMGLTPLGTNNGSFAVVLGTHDKLPNTLIKVVPLTDAYVDFARDMLDNWRDDYGDLFPKVYSVTAVDDFAVVLVERIVGRHPDHDEYWNADDDVSKLSRVSSYIEDLNERVERRMCDDTHDQNVIIRESDDEWIWIDPVYNRDTPNALIKVVPLTDAYVDFARDMLENWRDDYADLFPTVYSVTEVDDFAVVLVERVVGRHPDCDEYCRASDDVSKLSRVSNYIADLNDRAPRDMCDDTHDENVIIRESDGEWIWIDPVFNHHTPHGTSE